MNNPWQLYDELIAGLPPEPEVKYYQAGYNWTRVVSSENSVGLAMTIPINTRPPISGGTSLTGKPLREVALLVKSWNYVESLYKADLHQTLN